MKLKEKAPIIEYKVDSNLIAQLMNYMKLRPYEEVGAIMNRLVVLVTEQNKELKEKQDVESDRPA